jgi:hypothetical protein
VRLPWGSLTSVFRHYLAGRHFAIVGTISFERRGNAVPAELFPKGCTRLYLLEIHGPRTRAPIGWSDARAELISKHRRQLIDAGVPVKPIVCPLLLSEDQLLRIVHDIESTSNSDTLVLDITTLPKRYFCLLLKLFMATASFNNIIVTYAEPQPTGYSAGRLAEGPMPCEHLPGFAPPPPPHGNALVISVGFEVPRIEPLMEVYGQENQEIKFLLSFPPDPDRAQRQWFALYSMANGSARAFAGRDVAVAAAWDAELVYRIMKYWDMSSDGLVMAPHGPKPHTLGMTLWAIESDSGVYYAQPTSYNPYYSQGVGAMWAYVVKLDGIPCYAREETD